MCGATNHKSYGLGLTAFDEVGKRIVYILDYTIVFFYQYFYDTSARGALVQHKNVKAVSRNV